MVVLMINAAQQAILGQGSRKPGLAFPRSLRRRRSADFKADGVKSGTLLARDTLRLGKLGDDNSADSSP